MKSVRGSDGVEVVDSVANENLKSRKSSAFRPQSEWDIEEEEVKGKNQSEWNDGNSGPSKKSGLSNIFQSEWDVEEAVQFQGSVAKNTKPQSEWDDGTAKQLEKSRVASSFRPQSEWDDGGETKSTSKSRVASAFRPQSEWDIENEEGKLRAQSEWDVGTKARKASSFRPHSEWETPKPKESFAGDSFILGKSVYKSEYQQGEAEKKLQSEWNDVKKGSQKPAVQKEASFRPQSEWNDGAKKGSQKPVVQKEASFRPQSEWNDGAKKGSQKPAVQKEASFRPQSEWNDGANKGGQKPAVQKESSFRPQSEWNDGVQKKDTGKKSRGKSEGSKSRGKSEAEKERPQSEWDDKQKSKSRGRSDGGEKERPQSEWDDKQKSKSRGRSGGGEKERPQSEWDDKQKSKSRGRSGEGEKERPQSEWDDKQKSKSRGRSDGGEKERPQSEWNETNMIELPLDFRQKMQNINACDPSVMFASNLPNIVSLKFEEMDKAGLPSIMGGRPILPNDLKVLKEVQRDMAKRFKEMGMVRGDCEAVVSGVSQLKVMAIKSLAKELARIETAESFVLDPRTMFKASKNFTETKTSLMGRKMAAGLFGGMFSGFDEMGRPAAGRIGQGLTIAPPFSNLVKAAIFKMHKDQAQKFLDFYRPILDEYRNREISDYFNTGQYVSAFRDLTEDGLPLTTSDGKALSHQEKENYLRERSKALVKWEVEEQMLSKDMSAIANLYNQTSVKRDMKGVLRAYESKQSRTSFHETMKAAEEKNEAPVFLTKPQDMQFLLIGGIKAGLRFGHCEEGKLRIRKTLEGGLAAKAGLMTNDRVISVDGVSFQSKSVEEAKEALHFALQTAFTENRPLLVDVVRPASRKGGEPRPPLQFKCKIPKKDKMHVFLESDQWSVVVVLVVLLDAILWPFRDTYSTINSVGIVISLLFLTEICSRLYLWKYVEGTLTTFFLLDYRRGPAEGMPFRERVQYLNTLDCLVVFIDIMFLLVQLANDSAGGSLVSVVRLPRIGRVVRYFRILKNLRSSRISKVFQRNAHLIYHELLAWRYLFLLSGLVVSDAVLMGLYGRGHFDDDESPTHEALGYGVFVSVFCLFEYGLRIACHLAVLGEIKSFFTDVLNFFDSIVVFVDFILLCTLFSSGARDNGMAIKVFKVFRFIKSLKILTRCRRCVNLLTKKSPLFKKLMLFLFPPRLTAQQREDLEIYGEYFSENIDDDLEIGAEIVKLGSVAYDDDELEGAWEVMKYDPVKHVDLVQSNASVQGLVNPSMTKNMEQHVQISEGDVFMFNKLTGATKWNTTQMDNLMTKQQIKAKKRLIENERRVAVRELQHMSREEYAGQILRQLSNLEDYQLSSQFGQRIPFKHAGRYQVVHRGYATQGDGYGRRKQDCFLGQGIHSRTFCCSDTLGHFSNIVVKVSRNTEASLFAQRGEAGTLKSLERLDDEVRKKYFVMMLDSFDFGANENRFAMVFEQEGPSLGYVLSMYSRPPKEDPLYGKAGLSELDAEYMASAAPWMLDCAKAESEKKQQATGYLTDPPPLKRKGPVPRPPLPIGFIVDVLQQVCEAVTFLHEQAGMVHGDITPDNIVMVQRHEPSSRQTSALSLKEVDVSTPYVPTSSQIKLVDLNCACFIPVGLPNKIGFEDYEDEESAQLADATASPLVHSSIYLKRKAERRDLVPETTLSYRAPELDVFHSGWNGGVDVWSIGCLLVEMYSGKADFKAGMLAAEHAGPDTDSGLAVRAAAIPSLRDIGRCPLFRAETPFEHLAMVESCVGCLPQSIYERWSNIESPAMVGPYARARVASVAPLAEALEANRDSLARDQEARLALTKHHMGELANEENIDFFGSVFGNFNKNTEDDKLKLMIRDINLEVKNCSVEPWRKDAVADLAARMLNPDLEERITMRELVEHRALKTGMFAGFGAGLF